MLYRTNLVLEHYADGPERWRKVRELKDWCNKHVGVNNWRYYGEYTETPFDICFRYKEDLLLFKLCCT